MDTVSVVEEAPAPAARVWAVLADFGAFLDWAYGGGAGSIEVEGNGLGMVRHLDMGGTTLGERLDQLDHDARTMTYSLSYGEPLGMTQYRARIRVEELEEGRCALHWLGEFSVPQPEQAGAIADTLAGIYAGFTQALAAHANKTP